MEWDGVVVLLAFIIYMAFSDYCSSRDAVVRAELLEKENEALRKRIESLEEGK